MFVQNLIRRFSRTNICFGLDAVHKKTCCFNFGDPRMPDKLYKTVELEMRGSDPAVLESYRQFILTATQHLQITVGKVFSNKKPTFHRFTVLKSAFVHRKHLVQYEVRTYYSFIHLKKLTGSTADTFLEYVERMLPEGVALKVTKVAVEPLADHLTPQKISQSAEVIQNFEMELSSEVSQNAEANQSSEVSQNAEVNESSEVSQNSEVNQSSEFSQNSEVNESSEVSQNAEVNKSSEVSQNAEVNQSSEVSQNGEISQILNSNKKPN